jgi:hypothetical protein
MRAVQALYVTIDVPVPVKFYSVRNMGAAILLMYFKTVKPHLEVSSGAHKTLK